MKHIAILSIAGGALAAALAFPAAAQNPPARTITRDEYRACMNTQDDLTARAASIKERGAKLNEESTAIKAEEEQLREEQKRAEDSSISTMRQRVERKISQHGARVRTAQATSDQLQADIKQFTGDLDAHNAKCANVAVNREDREAVTKEREAAGKK